MKDKLLDFKSIAESMVLAGSPLNEAREVELYIEDKLLSATLTAPESDEISFFTAGGSDDDTATAGEKQKSVRLLYRTLKLLQVKGYFGDVQKFWSNVDVKRKLANYGILHAPLAQPIRHKQFTQLLKNAGLDAVSAQQYDKAKERDMDDQVDPDELQRYQDAPDEPDDDYDGNVSLANDKRKTKKPATEEEALNIVERMMRRKELIERPIANLSKARAKGKSMKDALDSLESITQFIEGAMADHPDIDRTVTELGVIRQIIEDNIG